MNRNEVYTLVYRGNFGSVNFMCFIDREKMKREMLRHLGKGDDCYIVPGVVELVDFNVRHDEDGHIQSVHMEDEPDYVVPTRVATVVIGKGLADYPDENRKCSQ